MSPRRQLEPIVKAKYESGGCDCGQIALMFWLETDFVQSSRQIQVQANWQESVSTKADSWYIMTNLAE